MSIISQMRADVLHCLSAPSRRSFWISLLGWIIHAALLTVFAVPAFLVLRGWIGLDFESALIGALSTGLVLTIMVLWMASAAIRCRKDGKNDHAA